MLCEISLATRYVCCFLIVIFSVFFLNHISNAATAGEYDYSSPVSYEDNSINRASSVVYNGWLYTIRAEDIVEQHVGNFTYDSYGRVVQFTYASGTGRVVYSNDVYDSSGNLIASTLHLSGIPDFPFFTATAARVSELDYLIAEAKHDFTRTERSVSASILRSERRAVEGMLYNRLRMTMLPGAIGRPVQRTSALSGVASGDAAPGNAPIWSMWIDGALTSMGNSRTGLQNSATSVLGLVGLECAWTERLVTGLAFGYSNITTAYHNRTGANQFDSGFIINPYLGYSPLENLLVSVQGGLTLTSTSVTGHDAILGVPFSYNSDYSVVTTAIGADVAYALVWDRLVVTPHAGYSYSNRQPQGGNVGNVEQGMLNAGATLGYNCDKVTPFISALYSYDTIGQTRLAREDMLGTAGLTLHQGRFQGTLSVSNAFFRYKEYETTVNLNLRYTF